MLENQLFGGIHLWETDCIRPVPIQRVPKAHRSKFGEEVYEVYPSRRSPSKKKVVPHFCGSRPGGRKVFCDCDYWEQAGKRCSHLWAMESYRLHGSVLQFEERLGVVSSKLFPKKSKEIRDDNDEEAPSDDDQDEKDYELFWKHPRQLGGSIFRLEIGGFDSNARSAAKEPRLVSRDISQPPPATQEIDSTDGNRDLPLSDLNVTSRDRPTNDTDQQGQSANTLVRDSITKTPDRRPHSRSQEELGQPVHQVVFTPPDLGLPVMGNDPRGRPTMSIQNEGEKRGEVSPIGRRHEVQRPLDVFDLASASDVRTALAGRPSALAPPLEPRRKSHRVVQRSSLALPRAKVDSLDRPTGLYNTGIDCYALALFQMIMRQRDWNSSIYLAYTAAESKDDPVVKLLARVRRAIHGHKPMAIARLKEILEGAASMTCAADLS